MIKARRKMVVLVPVEIEVSTEEDDSEYVSCVVHPTKVVCEEAMKAGLAFPSEPEASKVALLLGALLKRTR